MASDVALEATSKIPQRIRPAVALVLAPLGDGSRRRSGADVVRLITGLCLLVILGLLAHAKGSFQVTIVNAIHPAPEGFRWLLTTLWWVGSAGVIVLCLGTAVVRARFDALRDLVTSALLALACSYLIQSTFGASLGFAKLHLGQLPGVDLGFPKPLLGASVAVVLGVRPYLSRGLQRFFEVLIALAVVGGLVSGAGLPMSILAAVVIGWMAAAGTHLLFGSPTGIPDAAEVLALLESLDMPAADLAPAPFQSWGLARFQGSRQADGAPIRVSVYGRDAHQSQLLVKLYRSLFVKGDVESMSLTRAQQQEHESYVTSLASEAAPDRTSTLLIAGRALPSKDAVVVVGAPPGIPLATLLASGATISDAVLGHAADIIASLRDHHVAHGQIDLTRFLVDGEQVGLVDFERGVAFPGSERAAKDVSDLLITLALASSTDRSVQAVLGALGPEALASALPFIQEAAIPDTLTTQLLHARDRTLLKDLRTKGAAAASVELPDLAILRRVTLKNALIVGGTLFGAWAMIGVFAHVAQSAGTLRHADIPWVIATAVIAQLCYVGAAFSTMGAVTVPMAFWPLIMLELFNSFGNLTIGETALLAARIRFFQKQGMDTQEAIGSGVVVSTASTLIKVLLLVFSIPFALHGLNLKAIVPHVSHHTAESLFVSVLVVIISVGVALGIVVAVPKLRRLVKDKIGPKVRELFDHCKTLLRSPAKVLQIFGGMLIAQLVIVFALGTALHAFGHHLSLPILIFILTFGAVLGDISPAPGGLGVCEAGMILGLKAAGIPTSAAVATVFVQRLFTAYLPPIGGWFAMMWLNKRDFL